MLPEVLTDWGWRALGLLSIRYMAGSWLVTGLWWLFPGSIIEITAGNVTFQIAALTVAGLRGIALGSFRQHSSSSAVLLWSHTSGSVGPKHAGVSSSEV